MENKISAGIVRDEMGRGELIALFETIALEQGWSPGDQLTTHVERSVYFGARVCDKLVGGIQLEIPNDAGGWSFQSVWPEVSPVTSKVAAYASMFALVREFRGDRILFWLPCIEMWRYCREKGIQDIWLAATPATLGAYRRMGWPLAVQSDMRIHWGEECFLTNMSVDAVEASIVGKASKADTYRKLVEYGYGPRLAASLGK